MAADSDAPRGQLWPVVLLFLLSCAVGLVVTAAIVWNDPRSYGWVVLAVAIIAVVSGIGLYFPRWWLWDKIPEVSAIQSTLAGVQKRLQAIESGLTDPANGQTKLDQITTTLAELRNKLDAVERALQSSATIGTKLTDIASQLSVADLPAKLAGIDSKLQPLGPSALKLDTIAAQVDSKGPIAAKLESIAEQFEPAGPLRTKLDAIDAKIKVPGN